jgi:sarcosine oxidase subunit alpha
MARSIVAGLGLGVDLAPQVFPHMHLRCTAWERAPLRIRRASYTGELSYEIDIAADRAEALWLRLLEIGASHGIRPLGMEALDRLRIEKGFLEVGVDTDGETTPLDVGWKAAIARKPDDFLGRRSLQRPAQQREDRLQLVGLLPENEQGCVPIGAHALDESGKVMGYVTSSCFSPHLNRSIAMGRIRAGSSRSGEIVNLDVEGRVCRATLVNERAFFDPRGERVNA